MDRPDPSPASDLGCERAAELARRFLAGSEVVSERLRLRAHLARCASCRQDYDAQVLLIARLARAPRATRGRRDRADVWPTDASPAPAPAQARAHARARRAAGVLLPVFGLIAFFVLARATPLDTTLQRLVGDVRLGRRTLADGDRELGLARSSACSTGIDGRARIAAEGGALVLEPRTALVIERPRPLRVRLFEGTLLAAGKLTIATALGVIELEAEGAAVHCADGVVTFTCRDGSARWIDPDGARTVLAGENARFPAAAAVAAAADQHGER